MDTQKCNHDIANAIRKGRATWVCPLCGADISLLYVLYMRAFEKEEKDE